MSFKVGIGFDVHAFAEGRPLIIGGVSIPYEKGLAGHSDADVLSHAITDAITGVTLGKDIGNLFPDNDIKYKGADSIKLMGKALNMIEEKGFKVSSVDAVIIAQTPKMSPHVDAMRKKIAKTLKLEIEDITIKSTTTEYLGFVGRKEGIAAVAVAVVKKN